MEQASQMDKTPHNLRIRILQLLHSRQAARRFHFVAYCAPAQILSYLAFTSIAGIIDEVRHIRPWGTDPSNAERAIATALSALVMLGFAITRYSTLKTIELPKERI